MLFFFRTESKAFVVYVHDKSNVEIRRPHEQHDAMVSGGLCQEACRFPRHHRYCNQFPLDSHLVRGVPKVPYINASRMKLLGWKQVRGDLSHIKVDAR